MLYDKKRLRTYAQILTILDGFIAVTGLILLASNFVEIIVPLIMIGLIASASLFSYDVIKRN
jgi:hypothetical protein